MNTNPAGGPNKARSFNIFKTELQETAAGNEIEKVKGELFAGHNVTWIKVTWHLGFDRGLMFLFNINGYEKFVMRKLDEYIISDKRQEIRGMEDTLMKGLDDLHLKQEIMESNARIKIDEVSSESIPSMWGEERLNEVIGGSMVLTILKEIEKLSPEMKKKYQDTLLKNIQNLPKGDFQLGALAKLSNYRPITRS